MKSKPCVRIKLLCPGVKKVYYLGSRSKIGRGRHPPSPVWCCIKDADGPGRWNAGRPRDDREEISQSRQTKPKVGASSNHCDSEIYISSVKKELQ